MGLNVHAIKWHWERVLKGEVVFPITAVLKVYLAFEPLEAFIVWKKKKKSSSLLSAVTMSWKEILHCHSSWCRKVWSVFFGLAAVTSSGFPINFRDFAGIPPTLIYYHGYEFHVPLSGQGLFVCFSFDGLFVLEIIFGQFFLGRAHPLVTLSKADKP